MSTTDLPSALRMLNSRTEEDFYTALLAWAEERDLAGDHDGADCLRWCVATKRSPLGWIQRIDGGQTAVSAQDACPESKRACNTWLWWSPDEMTAPSYNVNRALVTVELWDELAPIPFANASPYMRFESLPAAYYALMRVWRPAKNAGWDREVKLPL